LSWSIAVARLTVKELVVSEGTVFEPAAADDEDVDVDDDEELEDDDDEQPAATRATAATPATQPSRERHPPCLLLPISIHAPFT
jgi:hypothetical protein